MYKIEFDTIPTAIELANKSGHAILLLDELNALSNVDESEDIK